MKAKKTFVIEATYHGYSSELDEKIEKAAGISSDGSGCGFGGRDISFSFKTIKAAQHAAMRIAKITGVDVSEIRECDY